MTFRSKTGIEFSFAVFRLLILGLMASGCSEGDLPVSGNDTPDINHKVKDIKHIDRCIVATINDLSLFDKIATVLASEGIECSVDGSRVYAIRVSTKQKTNAIKVLRERFPEINMMDDDERPDE